MGSQGSVNLGCVPSSLYNRKAEDEIPSSQLFMENLRRSCRQKHSVSGDALRMLLFSYSHSARELIFSKAQSCWYRRIHWNSAFILACCPHSVGVGQEQRQRHQMEWSDCGAGEWGSVSLFLWYGGTGVRERPTALSWSALHWSRSG